MTPTLDWTIKNFKTFNALYFNNELPTPRFRTVNARSYFGLFRSYRENWNESAKEVSARNGMPNGEITMSTHFSRTELACLGTLLHEMIHLWQYWNEKPHGHGADFKRMCRKFNVDGWGLQRCGGCPTEKAWKVYCKATNTKVTPKHAPMVVTEFKVRPLNAHPRQIAALRRSIAHLEAMPVLSDANAMKLRVRKAELASLL